MVRKSQKIENFFTEVKKEYRGLIAMVVMFVVSSAWNGLEMPFGILVAELKKVYASPLLELTMINLLPQCMKCLLAFVPALVFRCLKNNRNMWIMVFGNFMGSLGLFTSAFVPSPPWLFLTYSLLYGIGACCYYLTSLNICNSFFPLQHKYHVGILASHTLSNPLGSVVLSPVVTWWIERAGWRGTFGFLAALFFLCIPLCIFFKDPKKQDDETILVVAKDSCGVAESSERVLSKDAKTTSNYQSITQHERTKTPAIKESTTMSETAENSSTYVNEDAAEIDGDSSKTGNKESIWSAVKERREIVLWWLGIGAHSIVFYGTQSFLADFFLSMGVSAWNTSAYISSASTAGIVACILSMLVGRFLQKKLILVVICSNALLAVVLGIWSFLPVNHPTYLTMSILYGTLKFISKSVNYVCSCQVTGLSFSDSLSSSMVSIGIAIFISPFFTGMVYDIFGTYKASFICMAACLTISIFCYCTALLIKHNRTKTHKNLHKNQHEHSDNKVDEHSEDQVDERTDK